MGNARLLALLLLAPACTLLVDNELSKPGGCDELSASDGTPGSSVVFHAGVTTPAFSGPAYPTPGKQESSFGSTLAFLRDGGLDLVGGTQGESLFFKAEEQHTPTAIFPGPGHEGPGSYGCSEIFAATYDPLRDRTDVRLVPGGCADNSVFLDAGVFPGQVEGAALGWAGSPDGGAGAVAALLGARAQSCDEVYPLSCIPPSGGDLPPSATRRVSALTAADGAPVWIVASDTQVQLFSKDFRSAIGAPVASGGPARVAAIASDIGIAVQIAGGKLQTQVFDAAGRTAGAAGSFDLGDAAAHGLEIARFGTAPRLRVAWLTGDGHARLATLDATNPAAQQLVSPVTVCGPAGATFAAPLTPTTAAVLIGDALYFRRAP